MIAIVIFRKKLIELSHRYLKCGPQYGPFVKTENGGKNYLFGFQKTSLCFLYERVYVCWGLFCGLKGHEGTQIKMKKLF